MIYLIAAALVGTLGVQLWNLYGDNRKLSIEVEKLTAELTALQSESSALRSDLEYFSDPENLAKELKSRFDYRRPDETLIKVQ